MLKTFFNGSTEQAVVTLLEMSDTDMTSQDMERLTARVLEARREGR